MKVTVVNSKRQSKTDRHGWSVDLKVDDPPKKVAIYQNVYVSMSVTNSKGEKDQLKYRFTEAWSYNPKKNITDSFLVPLEWRKNHTGRIRINTVLWSEEGEIDPSLKKGENYDYWGNLHGSFDMLTPIEPVTIRNFKAEWNNVGKTASTHFTKGKDLKVIKDNVS